jgi:hypothetical protein
MNHYYLWSGIDAIEDLDDCDNLDEALRELRSKVTGDWTLWRRDGYRAKLIAIYKPESNVFQQFPVIGIVKPDDMNPDDWRPGRNL